MITHEQFQLQIDRLSDTFGERHFPDQRAHMIWESVCELEYPSVIAIVDTFIRGSKYAPLPIDFSEAVKGFSNHRRKHSLGEIKPKELASCHDCSDSGFIRIERKETFEQWARAHIASSPCHCQRGLALIEAGRRRPREPIDFGPQFHESWLKSYSIIDPYEGAA